jgi:hypothetical protein
MSQNQDNTTQFLKSRIFIGRAHAAKQSISSKSNLQIRTPEEAFQHDAHVDAIPPISDYGRENFSLLGDPNQPQDKKIGAWITVIGYIPGRADELINYLSRYGIVERFEEGPGNWCYIEFQSKEIANLPILKAKSEPIIIANNYIVSVAAGRLKQHYMSAPPLPKKVEYVPKITKEYAKERKSIISTIVESIFGD